MKAELTKEKLAQKLNSVLERKRLIRAYVHGEISLQELHERGVKLVLPL